MPERSKGYDSSVYRCPVKGQQTENSYVVRRVGSNPTRSNYLFVLNTLQLFFPFQKMNDDELINTMYKLLENRDAGKMKTDDDSIIFIQHGNNLSKINYNMLTKLSNSDELKAIIHLYENRKPSENILIAYHNDRFIGIKNSNL